LLLPKQPDATEWTEETNLVKLEPMDPELCIIKEMKRSIRNLLVLWCAPNLEVTIASIEPRKWITRAIVLGKLQLVDRQEILIIVVFFSSAATARTRTCAQAPVPDRGLDAAERYVEAADRPRGLQFVDLIMQRLEWLGNVSRRATTSLSVTSLSVPEPAVDSLMTEAEPGRTDTTLSLLVD
jgi:hypothetical protein